MEASDVCRACRIYGPPLGGCCRVVANKVHPLRRPDLHSDRDALSVAFQREVRQALDKADIVDVDDGERSYEVKTS